MANAITSMLIGKGRRGSEVEVRKVAEDRGQKPLARNSDSL